MFNLGLWEIKRKGLLDCENAKKFLNSQHKSLKMRYIKNYNV